MPGWGHQLPPHRVLSEMADAGFRHTELGSLGYLPTEPDQLRSVLDSYGLSLLGGFVPLVLGDPRHNTQTRAEAHRWARLISSAGGAYFVTCVISHPDEWRQAPLRRRQWARVCRLLAELDELTGSYGLTQALHPHVGSLVETDSETRRALGGSNVSIVLDTAHLTLGGTDVVQMVEQHSDRIALVHLKDVDLAVAKSYEAGKISFMQAVQRGLFPPLGRGGVPIAEIITLLEESGRDLWYVLEQDAAIAPGDPGAMEGLRRDVHASLDFLRSLLPATAGSVTNNQLQLQEG